MEWAFSSFFFFLVQGDFNFEIDCDYSARIETDYGAVEVSSVVDGGSNNDDDVWLFFSYSISSFPLYNCVLLYWNTAYFSMAHIFVEVSWIFRKE